LSLYFCPPSINGYFKYETTNQIYTSKDWSTRESYFLITSFYTCCFVDSRQLVQTSDRLGKVESHKRAKEQPPAHTLGTQTLQSANTTAGR